MAKRRSSKKQNSGLSEALRPEIVGILFLLLGLLTLLSLIPVERGMLMEGWIGLLQTAVGWGAWVMPVFFGGLGLWLILVGLGREPNQFLALVGCGWI